MRSTPERILHVTLFEAGALVLVSPIVSLATGASLLLTGGTSLVGSVVATLMTFAWTWICDRWTPSRIRPVWIRALQALGLEILLALYSIPVFLWLGATLRYALLLELGAIMFFGSYTWLYNTAFDAVVVLLKRRNSPAIDASQDQKVRGIVL